MTSGLSQYGSLRARATSKRSAAPAEKYTASPHAAPKLFLSSCTDCVYTEADDRHGRDQLARRRAAELHRGRAVLQRGRGAVRGGREADGRKAVRAGMVDGVREANVAEGERV